MTLEKYIAHYGAALGRQKSHGREYWRMGGETVDCFKYWGSDCG